MTGPRLPCLKQERKVQITGFLKETIRARRTGLYLRVLEPGLIQAGDPWRLESRPNDWLTVDLVNQAYFGPVNRKMIEQMLLAPELPAEWKQLLSERIRLTAGCGG